MWFPLPAPPLGAAKGAKNRQCGSYRWCKSPSLQLLFYLRAYIAALTVCHMVRFSVQDSDCRRWEFIWVRSQLWKFKIPSFVQGLLGPNRKSRAPCIKINFRLLSTVKHGAKHTYRPRKLIFTPCLSTYFLVPEDAMGVVYPQKGFLVPRKKKS